MRLTENRVAQEVKLDVVEGLAALGDPSSHQESRVDGLDVVDRFAAAEISLLSTQDSAADVVAVVVVVVLSPNTGAVPVISADQRPVVDVAVENRSATVANSDSSDVIVGDVVVDVVVAVDGVAAAPFIKVAAPSEVRFPKAGQSEQKSKSRDSFEMSNHRCRFNRTETEIFNPVRKVQRTMTTVSFLCKAAF